MPEVSRYISHRGNAFKSANMAFHPSFIFYYVSRDPGIQKKLFAEIDAAWAKHGEALDGSKLSMSRPMNCVVVVID